MLFVQAVSHTRLDVSRGAARGEGAGQIGDVTGIRARQDVEALVAGDGKRSVKVVVRRGQGVGDHPPGGNFGVLGDGSGHPLSTGLVMSMRLTVIVKVPVPVFPWASVAVHVTVAAGGLIGKFEPEAGVHVTGSPSMLSVAVGAT